jgi:hypothetical protein
MDPTNVAPAPRRRLLAVLIVIYLIASLLHFIHNAEYLKDYPGLPPGWTRLGVYAAWFGVTATGLAGVWLLRRGWPFCGLAVLTVYALLGLDSLGHYLVAPLSSHTHAMNISILAEVGAALAVLGEVVRQFALTLSRRRAGRAPVLPAAH